MNPDVGPSSPSERAVALWLREVVAGYPAWLGAIDDGFVRVLRDQRLDLLAARHGAEHPLLLEADKSAFVRTTLMARAAAGALDVLSTLGVPAAVIKGLPLGARFWGDAAARPASDIDVLVRPSDVAAAQRAFEEAGFAHDEPLPAWYVDRHFYHTCFRCPGPAPFLFELHWDIKRAEFGVTPVGEMLAEAVEVDCGNRVLRALSPECQVVVSAVHVLRHGLAVRDLLDVALIAVTLDSRGWREVTALATRCGVERLLYVATMVAAARFDYRVDPHLRSVRPGGMLGGYVDRLISELPLVSRPGPSTVRRLKTSLALSLGARGARLAGAEAVHWAALASARRRHRGNHRAVASSSDRLR